MKKVKYIAALFLLFGCGSASQNRNDENYIPKETDLKFTEKQSFTINSATDTAITLQSGSVWEIDGMTFADSAGNIISGPVTLNIYEYDRLEKCIMEGLSTQSDKGILETDGMLYFMPEKDGKNLTLQKGIRVKHKSNINRLNEPRLFKGKNDRGTITWVEDTAQIKNNLLVQYRPGPLDTFHVYSDGVYVTIVKNQKDTIDVSLIDTSSVQKNSSYYFYQLTFTGWINVDRYLGSSDHIAYTKLDSKNEAMVYNLLISNSSVLIRGVKDIDNNERIKFEYLPASAANNRVYLIVFNYNENGTCTYGIKEISLKENKVHEFISNEYRTTGLAEFKEYMASFLKEYVLPQTVI